MPLTVTMPQLGESVTEGTIARWLKQPGESIAKYESIAEVVTDKVNAEIPAPADGTLGEVIAPEGSVVAVGQPICTIATEGSPASDESSPAADVAGSAAPEPPTQQAAPPPAAPPTAGPPSAAPRPAASQPPVAPPQTPAEQQASPPTPSIAARTDNGAAEGMHLTPAVRMLIREHGVDVSQVKGTGFEGRVTKKDVLEYVQQRDAAQRAVPPAATARSSPPPPPAPSTTSSMSPAPMPSNQAPSQSVAEGDRMVPMTPVRRAIAEHMVRSKATSPHAWMTMEVDMTSVVRARTAQRAAFKERHGVDLTFLPFTARATVTALAEFPTLNAVWTDDGLVLKRDIHLGIAVALEDNLIVPVVRNADRLNLAGLALTMTDLGARARANRLRLDEIQGGTFTLNNTGSLGTVLTQPIINQPQAAILATDAVIKRPVVVEGDAIAVRSMMNICLSFDHRLNDGLQATRFLRRVKELLERVDSSEML